MEIGAIFALILRLIYPEGKFFQSKRNQPNWRRCYSMEPCLSMTNAVISTALNFFFPKISPMAIFGWWKCTNQPFPVKQNWTPGNPYLIKTSVPLVFAICMYSLIHIVWILLSLKIYVHDLIPINGINFAMQSLNSAGPYSAILFI